MNDLRCYLRIRREMRRARDEMSAAFRLLRHCGVDRALSATRETLADTLRSMQPGIRSLERRSRAVSETRFRMQTWIRRNSLTLAKLGEPLNRLAAVNSRLAATAQAGNSALGTWDEIELTTEEADQIRVAGINLAETVALVRQLPPIPDAECAALLAESLDAYERVGSMAAGGDIAGRGWVDAMSTATEAFDRVAEAIAKAAA